MTALMGDVAQRHGSPDAAVGPLCSWLGSYKVSVAPNDFELVKCVGDERQGPCTRPPCPVERATQHIERWSSKSSSPEKGRPSPGVHLVQYAVCNPT